MTGCLMHVATLIQCARDSRAGTYVYAADGSADRGGLLAWPTSLSPVLVKATTDGVVRPPS